MTSQFGILLDILKEAFQSPISERDYHMIVELLRNYNNSRIHKESELNELQSRGWPLNYDPCEHMERIRFAMVFGEKDNDVVQTLLKRLQM
jgi:hypothetical protein